MDAKATVKVGPFARGGKSRILTKAADHDFHPAATVTPVGIFLPASDEFFLYGVTNPARTWYTPMGNDVGTKIGDFSASVPLFTLKNDYKKQASGVILTTHGRIPCPGGVCGVTSKVTSDCLVDRLVDWWEEVKDRFSQIKTLVINVDNGPENHSRRTQFMQRLVEFVQQYQIIIRLAYYPPYHSKYNPIERCWGILEQHWNGSLLESVNTVIQYAKTMTWKGKHPVVELVTTAYSTGVKLTKEAMDGVETQLQRLPTLEKWFVDIRYVPFQEIRTGHCL